MFEFLPSQFIFKSKKFALFTVSAPHPYLIFAFGRVAGSEGEGNVPLLADISMHRRVDQQEMLLGRVNQVTVSVERHQRVTQLVRPTLHYQLHHANKPINSTVQSVNY